MITLLFTNVPDDLRNIVTTTGPNLKQSNPVPSSNLMLSRFSLISFIPSILTSIKCSLANKFPIKFYRSFFYLLRLPHFPNMIRTITRYCRPNIVLKFNGKSARVPIIIKIIYCSNSDSSSNRLQTITGLFPIHSVRPFIFP